MQNPKFKVFTITTDEDKVERLLNSAVKLEIPLDVQVVTPKGYERFINLKHLYIYEAMIKAWTEGFNNFMFVDAWDTVFVGPIPSGPMITDKLWFGAEKNCYPDESIKSRYLTPCSGPFPYLNSGVIWGRVEKYLERCPIWSGHDQEMWTKEYLNGGIHLDHSAAVVLNLHSTRPDDLSRFPDGVRYNPTGTWPCVLHGNGKWPIPQWAGV